MGPGNFLIELILETEAIDQFAYFGLIFHINQVNTIFAFSLFVIQNLSKNDVRHKPTLKRKSKLTYLNLIFGNFN